MLDRRGLFADTACMDPKPSACCDYFRDGQIWFAVAPAGTTFVDGTDTKCSNPALIPSLGLVQLKSWIDSEGLVDLVAIDED